MEQKKGVAIELKYHEALVLFEWLSNFIDDTELEGLLPSERRVLWDMQCVLEKNIDEVFSSSYGELVEEARKKVEEWENGSEACE
jgi:hypothetical protein